MFTRVLLDETDVCQLALRADEEPTVQKGKTSKKPVVKKRSKYPGPHC